MLLVLVVYVNLLFKVSDPQKGVLYNVLYVPKLTCNLFSVKAAVAKGSLVQNDVEFGIQKENYVLWVCCQTSCTSWTMKYIARNEHYWHQSRRRALICGISD